MRRAELGTWAATAVTCAAVVAGCGSSGGPVTLNLLGPLDPGGTNVKAAAACSTPQVAQIHTVMARR